MAITITEPASAHARELMAVLTLPLEQARAAEARLARILGETEVVELEPVSVAVRTEKFGDRLEVVTSLDPASVHPFGPTFLSDFLADLTRHRLDSESGFARLHGGAVADLAGRGALLLGQSGAGKSTMVAHLAATGLTLVNDEQISLHPDHGLVGGFTRPISIKAGGVKYLPAAVNARLGFPDGEFLVTAAQLGTVHDIAAKPAVVVILERQKGASPSWDVMQLGEAITAVASHNLDLEPRPEIGLRSFAWLASTVPVVRARYSTSAEGADLVRALLAHPPRHDPVSWSVSAGGSSVDGTCEASRSETDGVGSSKDVLAVSIGDDVVLYHRISRAMVGLNRAGAALWRELPVDRSAATAHIAFFRSLAEHGFVEPGAGMADLFRVSDSGPP